MAVKKSGLGKGLDSLIAPKTRPEQKTQTTSAAVKPEKETIVKTVVKKEEVKLEKDLEKEKRLQEATLKLKQKYGKNALLKGINLVEGATGKDRNNTIGGHKA